MPSTNLWPAMQWGFQDSLNPCGLTTLLIFIFFLQQWASTPRRNVILTTTFFISACTTKFLSVIGAFDRLLNNSIILEGIRIFYLILGIIFLGGSTGLLRLWWRSKRMEDTGEKQDVSLRGGRPWMMMKQSCLWPLIVIALSFGFFLTLTGSVLARDYLLFVKLFDISTDGGSRWLMTTVVILYCTASSTSILLGGVVRQWMVALGSRQIGTKFSPYVRVTAAAALLAVGLGLIYSFLIHP